MKIYRPDRFRYLPDAVLLDTDNTVYPYDPAHAAAQEAIRKKVTATFSISSADFDLAFDEAKRQVKARLDRTASSHSRLLYLQRMLEIMGLESQVLLALDFEQTYWRTFLSNAALFDGLKDVLEDIRLAGIPTAIVTDLTAQIQFRKMVYFGLDRFVDYIVTSEESGFDKPHRAPFQIALEKMQPKGNCIWMIGDNPVTDIGGARDTIGAITLQKVHKGVEVGVGDYQPDAYFRKYNDLRKLFGSLTRPIDSQSPED